jgi:hypothetical protein
MELIAPLIAARGHTAFDSTAAVVQLVSIDPISIIESICLPIAKIIPPVNPILALV